MKTKTWETLQGRIWDVQDDKNYMWDILTIEGAGTTRTFYLASEEKMSSLKEWLEKQTIDHVRFTIASGKMDRTERSAYVPGKRAGVGMFQFRLVLSHSIKEDMEVILKTFIRRNAIPGEVRYLERDEAVRLNITQTIP